MERASDKDMDSMRLSSIFLRLGVFAIAGVISYYGARAAVSVVEDRSVMAVQETLVDQRQEWASVLGDGLQVILEGEAPSEASRFRAMSAAGTVVDASRVIDNMSVIDTAGIAPPDFAVEILRNASGVSLIGLVPTHSDRDALARRITRLADGKTVTDLLEEADYPVPETWDDALDFGLEALEQLERSKISVTAQRVTINAISDSESEKRRLEAALVRQAPEGVGLAIAISAPRPVISPFTTRFVLDGDGARFAACAVPDSAAETQVIAAASAAGFQGRSTCVEALGVPSRTWGDANAMAIKAVTDLGGGTVTLADTDVSLVALEGTDQDLFDRVVGELENNLPDVFALEAELPQTPDANAEGPPQFTATRSPEGLVQLRGRVPDDLVNLTAENYAAARFGQGNVTMGTRIVEGLPAGWSVRILAGIEALSELSNGAVIVQPALIRVSGNSGNQTAGADITRLLIDKLGESAAIDIDVTYKEELDPIAGLPTPEECIARIEVVTEARKITFDPGSATLSASANPIVDDIAEILRNCPDIRMQISGYTDSQGREEMNLQLSKDRATAVLSALRMRRVPTSSFEADGFGEADPIADNDTEDGREANRRIEFSLIVPESAEEEPTGLEAVEAELPATDATEGAGDE